MPVGGAELHVGDVRARGAGRWQRPEVGSLFKAPMVGVVG